MTEFQPLRLSVIGKLGTRDELLESASQSLLRELNELRRGAATFAPAPPADAGTKALFGVSPEIVLSGGGIAASLIVPFVQNWLGSQKNVVGLCFTLKNDDGEDYNVEIGPNAPPAVVAKLSAAIDRATKKK